MLKGHSNFKVELIQTPKGYFVKKSNGERLHRQIAKQDKFREIIIDQKLHHLFEIPEILSASIKKDKCSIAMPFYNGKSILDLLENGDSAFLDSLINKLLLFINFEKEMTTYIGKNIKVCYCVQNIKEKLEKLTVSKIYHSKVEILAKDFLSYLLMREDEFGCYETLCHGDLTFSNMIFTDKIVLIDFCDCYIESFYQDVAKLLQEIRLEWSLLLNPEHKDIAKIKIAYQYLREQLENKLFEYDNKLVRIFYIMVLFRLLPYIKQDYIHWKVINELELQIKELKCT